MKPSGNTRYHFDKNFAFNPLDFGDFNLIQAGRRYLDEHAAVGDHTHLDWFELTVATKGSAKVYTDGEFCSISKGDIYLSFPGDIHDIRTENEKLDYDYFSFYCKGGALQKAYDGVWQYKRQYNSRVFKDEKIQYLLTALIAEFALSDEFSSEVISNVCRQIIIYAARDTLKSVQVSTDVSDAKVLCQQLMNYLDTHIYTVKNLEELGDVFSYNYSYLSDLFKKTTATTLCEYFRNRKLETARLLILKKSKSITEISDLLGYSSPFTFSRAYKKRYGYPPAKTHSESTD
jgi:AraC-like DNA-binding protein